MKALVMHELGGPERLVYEEVADPEAGPGQVVIDVKACGVNFPDLLMLEGKYQFEPPLPFSPGGEVAGVVAARGEGVERFAVGDRVVGMGLWGGYAERMVLGQERVLPVPDGVELTVAGATVTTYGTMLYALQDRAQLLEGETVLVLGAGGGVGTAAIELAKHMGARVIAAARGEEKLDACRALGADAVIDYAQEDLKARAKALSGGGVDVVVDPVGGPYAEPALRAMGWGGRYLVIGFAAGDIPRVPLNLPLLKSCAIVGVFWGAWLTREPVAGAAQLVRVGELIAEGALKPLVSRTVPLAEGAEALRALAAREVAGKVVLVP